LCGNTACTLITKGISSNELSPTNFAITDSHYGKTLSIYQCGACEFHFCPEAGDVTCYYEQLEDSEYERTREQRAVQAKHLLQKIQLYKPNGTLLDIGAGSGILVEQALRVGYQATGIEPSKWLVDQATKRSLPIIEGIFPDADKEAHHDVITLVDVLEHIHNPLQLLYDIKKRLNAGGIAIIVTPDVQSIPARFLGKKWWHYRVAHISYFKRKTLIFALQKAGLEPIAWYRPTWFFPLDYLLSRLGQYVPILPKLAKFNFTKNITLPLNLFDSWMIVVRKSV
jgi:SAM-dependent methyltransferase